MELEELKKSASKMSNAELIQEINKIRSRRRAGTSALATIKQDNRRKKGSEVSSLETMKALLASMDLEDLLGEDDEDGGSEAQ